MTKNVFNLIAGITGGVEVIASAVMVFLGAEGIMGAALSAAVAGSVDIAGTAVIEICSRFIDVRKEDGK